jgi:hypothetical protein
LEREIIQNSRELERKKGFLLSYPRTGTASLADSTARIMSALELKDEEQLSDISKIKAGRSFSQFIDSIPRHRLIKASTGPKRRAYLEFIQGCKENHRKDGKGEPVLDPEKISSSTHPLYDLYRLYRDY